jgi:hypothetical protein
MATADTITSIKANIADITKDPIESLINRGEWGEINFVKSTEDINSIFSMLKPLQILNLEDIPENNAQEILSSTSGAKNTINQIRQFRISGSSDPAGRRDSIQSELKANRENIYNYTSRHVAYLFYRSGDADAAAQKIIRSVEEIKKQLDEVEEYEREKRIEIDGLVQATREAAAEAGVAEFTRDFTEAADGARKSAQKWLYWSVGISLVTLIFSLTAIGFALLDPPSSIVDAVSRVVSKSFVLAVLLGATAWTAKIYKSLKHLEAINRHRANAIKTFQAFVKSTADEATKNAVLLETTRSIFAVQASGFIDASNDAGSGDLKIVELVKAFSTKT